MSNISEKKYDEKDHIESEDSYVIGNDVVSEYEDHNRNEKYLGQLRSVINECL